MPAEASLDKTAFDNILKTRSLGAKLTLKQFNMLTTFETFTGIRLFIEPTGW